MNSPRFFPYAALVVGVLSVSTSAIFVKVTSAPAPVIAFYRLFFATILIAPVFLIKHRSELKTLSKVDWLYSTIAGVFLAFHFILWFESLNYTSVASSVVLVTLQPLFAFVGTYLFFKEKVSKMALCSGILAITGSMIISWGDFKISGLALFGDILSLVACAMITAYLLFGQGIRKRHSLTLYTFIVYGISSITLLLYCLLLQYPLGPYPTTDWYHFILLAIIPTLLGHSLFNWSLKWVSTNTISVMILFEPIGSIILAYFFLGEKMIPSQVAGGSIIMVGILLFVLEKQIKKYMRKELKPAS
ncbi:DMT family transporter [Metabacillus litoralis]|uniref:DMT family transporter n=1 Tax=Metabacillus litoralis TaxID=152268 RepID=UPI00203D86DA|nr:DMT family transporter [Metabacillus litoralis]MCM3160952.1 DMT family transporter [Metabacillus litoralis]MCM3413014.1 DMT family transporter [Metabacillus litoralis]